MKELSVNKLESLEGGKFWGWSDWDCSTSVGVGGECTTCTRTYSTFWIVVDNDVSVSCTEY